MNPRRTIKITNFLGDGSLPFPKRPSPSQGRCGGSGRPGCPKEGEIQSVRGWAPGTTSWWRWHLGQASKHRDTGESAAEGRTRPRVLNSKFHLVARATGQVFRGPLQARGPAAGHFRRAVCSTARIGGCTEEVRFAHVGILPRLSADSARGTPTPAKGCRIQGA